MFIYYTTHVRRDLYTPRATHVFPPVAVLENVFSSKQHHLQLFQLEDISLQWTAVMDTSFSALVNAFQNYTNATNTG